MAQSSIDDIRSLVIPLLSKWFANGGYEFGRIVITDTMVVWVSQLAGHPAEDEDRVYIPRAVGDDPQLVSTLRRWSQGYWAHLRLTEHEPVSRFVRADFAIENAGVTTRAARSEILRTLSTLSTDQAIRFMSVLAAEWARRFDTTGFLEKLRSLGRSPAPEAVQVGSYAALAALWFMDESFHLG
jgi:hypothetical protein